MPYVLYTYMYSNSYKVKSERDYWRSGLGLKSRIYTWQKKYWCTILVKLVLRLIQTFVSTNYDSKIRFSHCSLYSVCSSPHCFICCLAFSKESLCIFLTQLSLLKNVKLNDIDSKSRKSKIILKRTNEVLQKK